MRASHVEYLAPARFDDLLECFVRVSRLGRTSVTYEVAAYRLPDDVLMVTGTQTLVLIDRSTRRPGARSGERARARARVRGERAHRIGGSGELDRDAHRAIGRETGRSRRRDPLSPAHTFGTGRGMQSLDRGIRLTPGGVRRTGALIASGHGRSVQRPAPRRRGADRRRRRQLEAGAADARDRRIRDQRLYGQRRRARGRGAHRGDARPSGGVHRDHGPGDLHTRRGRARGAAGDDRLHPRPLRASARDRGRGRHDRARSRRRAGRAQPVGVGVVLRGGALPGERRPRRRARAPGRGAGAVPGPRGGALLRGLLGGAGREHGGRDHAAAGRDRARSAGGEVGRGRRGSGRDPRPARVAPRPQPEPRRPAEAGTARASSASPCRRRRPRPDGAARTAASAGR